MESTQWSDPDCNPAATPPFKGLRWVGFSFLILIAITEFILFNLQLSYISATGHPAMNWWIVFLPVLIPLGILLIVFLICAIMAPLIILDDKRPYGT
jgi:hypothetical protein